MFVHVMCSCTKWISADILITFQISIIGRALFHYPCILTFKKTVVLISDTIHHICESVVPKPLYLPLVFITPKLLYTLCNVSPHVFMNIKADIL